MSTVATSATAGFVLALLVSAGPPSARAEIIPYVDEKGRQLFINTSDTELRLAAEQGGVSAALHLMERRRRSLPGLEDHIDALAGKHSIDPNLIRAIIEVESAWNPRARSHKGALGLMQLLPETGARFGVRNFFDPKENVSGGVRYLRFLLDHFRGDEELALAAYNAGENAVVANGGVPPYQETRRYLRRIQTVYGGLDRDGSQGDGQGNGRIYAIKDESGRVIYVNE